MIERVAIAGTNVPLTDVFAAVTIRHGRGSADDGPLASTATLTLVNVDHELAAGFTVADTLEIDTTGAVPRFRGRITDAALGENGLSIVAVSALGYLAGRKVGAAAWPAEAWTARVTRAFTEADALAELQLVPPTSDPMLAGRDGEETTFGTILTELAETVPAAIADTPAGNVLVQALSSRQGTPLVPLDPLEVVYAPEWAMVDDVANVVAVEWDGGTVTAEDAASIAQFEERAPLTIATTLASAGDANARALLEVNRRSRPAWLMPAAELLALESTLAIGTPLVLEELPAWAPKTTAIGLLEGWEDHVEGDDWTMRLTLSDPRLSGYGLAWQDVPANVSWAEAGAVTWAEPDELLSILTAPMEAAA